MNNRISKIGSKVPASPYQAPNYPSEQLNPLVQPGNLQVNPAYPAPQPGIPNFPPQGPITNQPIGQADPNWMQKPPAIPNCPPGLEYLASIDQLLVHQKLDLIEIISNFEIENNYSIHNSLGQMVYHATEKSGSCMRNCCGASRSFEMIITNNVGQEVIHLTRPFNCQCCCCFCCLQTMEVCSPPGNVIGTIEQNCSLFSQSFSLRDPYGDEILKIKGPCCPISCGSDIDFEIFSVNDDVPIGKITKKWSGYLMEHYTNVDSFGISFPAHLDVKMKAVLLGALFLIDMMFFEQRKNRRNK